MTVSGFEAKHRLSEVGQTLRASDFTEMVYMATHDAVLVFDRAIVRRYHDWVLIWTEHNGYHIEHNDHIVNLRVGFRSQMVIPELGSEGFVREAPGTSDPLVDAIDAVINGDVSIAPDEAVRVSGAAMQQLMVAVEEYVAKGPTESVRRVEADVAQTEVERPGTSPVTSTSSAQAVVEQRHNPQVPGTNPGISFDSTSNEVCECGHSTGDHIGGPGFCHFWLGLNYCACRAFTKQLVQTDDTGVWRKDMDRVAEAAGLHKGANYGDILGQIDELLSDAKKWRDHEEAQAEAEEAFDAMDASSDEASKRAVEAMERERDSLLSRTLSEMSGLHPETNQPNQPKPLLSGKEFLRLVEEFQEKNGDLFQIDDEEPEEEVDHLEAALEAVGHIDPLQDDKWDRMVMPRAWFDKLKAALEGLKRQ